MRNILKGFTLIELLIVIVIIGILATALIPRLKGMQTKAKYARVERDFQDFRTAAFLAQTTSKKSLTKITGNWGTYSYCIVPGNNGLTNADFRKYGPDSNCSQGWKGALRKIEAAAGMTSGELAHLETDPRGQPYSLVEIDQVTVYGGNECDWNYDLLRSVGPNGYYWGHNMSTEQDDRELKIPGFNCLGTQY